MDHISASLREDEVGLVLLVTTVVVNLETPADQQLTSTQQLAVATTCY